MNKPAGHFLNWKVLIGGMFFGLAIFAVLVAILFSARAGSSTQPPAAANVKVIEAPTSTPIGLLPSPTPTATPKPSTTQVAPTPAGSNLIAVGSYVQVSGTEGDGLRLHSSASVSSKVNYVAIESEVFLVRSGPIDADGYIWWELEDPYTKNAVGWGVSNYLAIVQNP